MAAATPRHDFPPSAPTWAEATAAHGYRTSLSAGPPLHGHRKETEEYDSKQRLRRRVPRRRWGLLVIGGVLFVVGILLVGASVVLGSQTQSARVAAGKAWELRPTSLTTESAHFAWDGGAAGTTVWLVTGSVSCTSPGGVVASGAGGNGELNAKLNPGTVYALYGCSASGYETVSVNVTLSGGITWGEVLGTPLLVFGLPLLLIGARRRMPNPFDV